MLTTKVSIKSLLLVMALLALRQNAFAQADTIPALLQCRITGSIETYHYGNGPVYQLQYAAPNMVFASEGTFADFSDPWGDAGFLHVSVDSGHSFICRDTVPEDYGIPKSYILYRILENDKFQISRDTGKTWTTPEDLNSLPLQYGDEIDYSANGVRVSLGAQRQSIDKYGYDIAYTSSNSGLAWNTSWWQDTTQTIDGRIEPLIRWSDGQNGVLVTPNSYAPNPNDTPPPTNAYIAVTSDGGVSWRKVLQQGDQLYDILWALNGFDVEYPFPSIIIMRSEYGDQLSLDTGLTWQPLLDTAMDYQQQILCVTPGRWLASLSNGWSNDLNYIYGVNIPPTMSTDNGNTWKPVKYNGLNPITLMSFKDTLNGLASDGYDIVARTSDGGFTWETVDSSAYMYGHVSRAFGLDSAYYAFSPYSDSILNGAYAFFTRDRGATWQNILNNQPGYAFAGLDSEVWVGGTGFARIAWVRGGGTTFLISNRDSTKITAIDKNFVWVSDANQLYPAQSNVGNVTWNGDVAHNIPGYNSSDSYRFFPIDRNVVYVRAPDTVYVTKEGGINWSIAPAMPDAALDASHWFVFTSDTMSLNYTQDGGQNFTTVSIPNANARTILPIDSIRWYVNGFSTTDAGKSWQPIPGWDNKLALHPVDATTAFGEPFASTANTGQVQILWRLDLPFMTSPKAGIAEQEQQQPASEFMVFPNPATNAIQVTPPTGEISILDPLGRIYVLPRTGNTIDISSLPSGVYFVSAGNARTKFVKE